MKITKDDQIIATAHVDVTKGTQRCFWTTRVLFRDHEFKTVKEMFDYYQQSSGRCIGKVHNQTGKQIGWKYLRKMETLNVTGTTEMVLIETHVTLAKAKPSDAKKKKCPICHALY